MDVHAVEIIEGRALEIFAGAGVGGIDGGTPGLGVFLVDELGDGNFGEVGIAHEVGAIEIGAAEGFGGEVNGLGGAVAEFGEVEAFENVEDFDEGGAAGGWRRGADDVVAAIGAADGFALLDFVGGEIGDGDEASAFLDGGGEFAGEGAVVEAVGILRDALEGAGEFGLLKDLSGLIELAVAKKDALGFRELGEIVVLSQIARIFVGEREAVAGEFDGGRNYFFEGELAVFFFGVDQARYGAGNAYRAIADDAGILVAFG